MALRSIRNYCEDNKILRNKAKLVTMIDDKILMLLEDMAETMYAANGVGLAAPQIGILKRLVVIDVGTGLMKLINPEIIKESGEQQDMEACLSVPDKSGIVKRPEIVCIRALNEKGEIIEVEGTGLLARAFCHEIDHLDGTLFIDKMTSEKEFTD